MDSFATMKTRNELLCQGKINFYQICVMALDGKLKNGFGFYIYLVYIA